jgi:hypothetical protein
MTDKEKFLTFAESLYTFCTKQRHIISGEVLLLESQSKDYPKTVEDLADRILISRKMAELDGKSKFMIELLSHLNNTMVELGYGNENN